MAIRVFLSYSWDSTPHKLWVADLATNLRKDGLEAIIDQWAVVPGEQLPFFMERAVRDSDFVLVVCTHKYKHRSNERRGGVGYEGDIMTAEVFTGTTRRKFIPLLREGPYKDAAPSWLLGSVYIDFQGDPYPAASYVALLDALNNRLGQPPPLGNP